MLTLTFNGTETSATDLSFELNSCSLDKLNRAEHARSGSIPRLGRKDAITFPFGADVLFQEDRVRASNGTFSGGTKAFRGYAMPVKFKDDARGKSHSYQFQNARWRLSRILYQQKTAG